jgi:hypothetical protein
MLYLSRKVTLIAVEKSIRWRTGTIPSGSAIIHHAEMLYDITLKDQPQRRAATIHWATMVFHLSNGTGMCLDAR